MKRGTKRQGGQSSSSQSHVRRGAKDDLSGLPNRPALTPNMLTYILSRSSAQQAMTTFGDSTAYDQRQGTQDESRRSAPRPTTHNLHATKTFGVRWAPHGFLLRRKPMPGVRQGHKRPFSGLPAPPLPPKTLVCFFACWILLGGGKRWCFHQQPWRRGWRGT